MPYVHQVSNLPIIAFHLPSPTHMCPPPQSPPLDNNNKALKDYKLVTAAPVATSGQGDCWRIYDAVSQKAP